MMTKVGSVNMCRVVNGLWQTSGGWGNIVPIDAVAAMRRYSEHGLTSFDGADIYGPAEDLMGALRAQEPNVQLCSKWCPRPGAYDLAAVGKAISKTIQRVGKVDLIAFHWWDYQMWAGGFLIGCCWFSLTQNIKSAAVRCTT